MIVACRSTLRPLVCGVLLCGLLSACAGVPASMRAPLPSEATAFAAPSEPVGAEDLFAVSPAMRAYLQQEILPQVAARGATRALFDALYGSGELRLDYDSTLTRTAAQAFDARAGNCLSLVVMTAAFAKELGIDVRYESVFAVDAWSRGDGGAWLLSDHVTLTIGSRVAGPRGAHAVAPLRIDFLPAEDSGRLRTRTLSEATIVAMYLNNRAVERLLQGRLDDAHAWARAAIAASADFLAAHNTLGVIQRRRGGLAEAERSFRGVLGREPANTVAMANLAQVVRQAGRGSEADAIEARLARLQRQPPFHFFDLGLAAMRQGDYAGARKLFLREIARDAYYHEFHFWLGAANFMLGDLRRADRHLALALQYTTSQDDHAAYSGKIARMRAAREL
jgi:tetratricopeptide (TPR) repeat protein